MEDIEAFFKEILSQHLSIDIAEAEFKKIIAEDSELRSQYKEWCHEVGSSERSGFRDFCTEYRDSMDSVWENLSDFNEDF